MTRRGTLAYYLAAWVIGCFVMAFLQWLGEAVAGNFQPASILLTTYFFTLIFGAIPILLFALLLRGSMRLLRTHALWAWFLSGGILAALLTFILIQAQFVLAMVLPGRSGGILFGAFLIGTDFLFGHIWRVPVGGAITAVTLCLVDRAFDYSTEMRTTAADSMLTGNAGLREDKSA